VCMLQRTENACVCLCVCVRVRARMYVCACVLHVCVRVCLCAWLRVLLGCTCLYVSVCVLRCGRAERDSNSWSNACKTTTFLLNGRSLWMRAPPPAPILRALGEEREGDLLGEEREGDLNPKP